MTADDAEVHELLNGLTRGIRGVHDTWVAAQPDDAGEGCVVVAGTLEGMRRVFPEWAGQRPYGAVAHHCGTVVAALKRMDEGEVLATLEPLDDPDRIDVLLVTDEWLSITELHRIRATARGGKT